MSRKALENILSSLQIAVEGLHGNFGKTEWDDYYASNNNYGTTGLQAKEEAVRTLLASLSPATVWDLGANDGRFSRLAMDAGAQTVVAWDVDFACVERNYSMVRKSNENRLYPLLLDLTNPHPGVGWANAERASFLERGPVDAILALGLIHHLAISNNVPLSQVAALLAGLCHSLIIEWVPKQDSQVRKLLASRTDIFDSYTREAFEASFDEYFQIDRAMEVPHTTRVLYAMHSRNCN